MNFSSEDRSTSTQTAYLPLPEGKHLARIFCVAYVGSQLDAYQKKTKGTDRWVPTLRIGFEFQSQIPGSRGEVRYQSFTASMGSTSKLRKFVESVTQKTLSQEEAGRFDVKTLAGMCCLVEIRQTKKVRQLPDGSMAESVYDNFAAYYYTTESFFSNKQLIVFDMRTDDLSSLPEKLQQLVMQSQEWRRKYPDQMPSTQALGQTIPGRTIPPTATPVVPQRPQTVETPQQFSFE